MSTSESLLAVDFVVVVPVFNEEKDVAKFSSELINTLKDIRNNLNLNGIIQFVNDGSSDNTRFIIFNSIEQFTPKNVKVLEFSRNFGYQCALTAGIRAALSYAPKFIITMDGDGEHPVLLIQKMIGEWLLGHKIVHTKRIQDTKVPLLKRLFSNAFYLILSKLSGLALQPGMADFKLWDAKLLGQCEKYFDAIASFRVFSIWISPNGPILEYSQNFSTKERSNFTFRKMLSLAYECFVVYTDKALKLPLILGLTGVFVSLVMVAHALIAYLRGLTIQGWTSLVISSSFLFGLLFLSIAVLIEYLTFHVFRRNIPQYICLDHEKEKTKDF